MKAYVFLSKGKEKGMIKSEINKDSSKARKINCNPHRHNSPQELGNESQPNLNSLMLSYLRLSSFSVTKLIIAESSPVTMY